MRKLYITTSIPYVNADPHIGHALELIQADVIARYYRLLGSDVILQTGTDENAFKNVLAAKEQGITTAELAERNSGIFRKLVEKLDISAGSFIRTTKCLLLSNRDSRISVFQGMLPGPKAGVFLCPVIPIR